MALLDAWVDMQYYDSAERTRTLSYLLRIQYDTTANAGDGNMVDVLADAADFSTAVNILTWDSTPEYHVRLTVAGGGSPAIQANNQITAFTRIYDVNNVAGSFEVPAWDDTVYDEDNGNIIDPTYNTAAAVALLLLRNPDTGDNWALVPQFSQSRTRKSRNVVT